ncbi:MAG: radical SAM protein [bacterium]
MLLRQIQNPANPWHQHHVDFLGEPPPGRLVIYEEEANSVVTENKSPDIPFRYSVNPYRGCMHACAYCYARPSHQYLDFGAGTDFETKIVVKTNVAARLRQTLERRSWKGETICFSGNTDCYQPIEASYGLTRECLAVCSEFLNPVVIITKGSLVRRDIDVLEPLAKANALRVWISVGFDNEDDARKIDRGAPAIAQRLKSMALLRDAGISVGVSVSPIPGSNSAQLPSILEAAAAHGADAAFMTLLNCRLRSTTSSNNESSEKAATAGRQDFERHRRVTRWGQKQRRFENIAWPRHALASDRIPVRGPLRKAWLGR